MYKEHFLSDRCTDYIVETAVYNVCLCFVSVSQWLPTSIDIEWYFYHTSSRSQLTSKVLNMRNTWPQFRSQPHSPAWARVPLSSFFSSNFNQFFLFFLKLYLFSSSFWPSRWASRPTGKALATPLRDRTSISGIITHDYDRTRPLCLAGHMKSPFPKLNKWRKWKSTFLTYPCHDMYRVEAVGLKSSNYTLKITILVNMWNLGQFRENLIFCQ